MPTSRPATPSNIGSEICRGVTEGNRPLVDAIVTYGKAVHELRGQQQVNTDKLYSLDSEVKLLKGFIVSLQGTGDGTSGSVPQLQRDVRVLNDGVNGLKSEFANLRGDVSSMAADIKAMRETQTRQDQFTSTVKGGAWTAKVMIGTCVAALGTMATVLVYLFTHGLKP